MSLPKMPEMPRPTTLPGLPSMPPVPKVEKSADDHPFTGRVEKKHKRRVLNPDAKLPQIRLWKSEDTGEWLARLFYNGVHTHTIRPTRDMAHEACLQWYMNETRQGMADSTEAE